MSKDKLSPVPNMASSGLRKMLILIIFQHWMVYKHWCVLQFYGHLMGCYTAGRHFALYFLACNVPWQMLLLYFRRMLLPYFWQMLLSCCICGRCYNHQADVTACYFANWQMLLPSFCFVANVIAIIDCVADVILPSNHMFCNCHQGTTYWWICSPSGENVLTTKARGGGRAERWN